MATIAEQLASLNTIKTNIKAALIAKGASVTDGTPFADYAALIQDIKAKKDMTNGIKKTLYAKDSTIAANQFIGTEMVLAGSSEDASDYGADITDAKVVDLQNDSFAVVYISNGAAFVQGYTMTSGNWDKAGEAIPLMVSGAVDLSNAVNVGAGAFVVAVDTSTSTTIYRIANGEVTHTKGISGKTNLKTVLVYLTERKIVAVKGNASSNSIIATVISPANLGQVTDATIQSSYSLARMFGAVKISDTSIMIFSGNAANQYVAKKVNIPEGSITQSSNIDISKGFQIYMPIGGEFVNLGDNTVLYMGSNADSKDYDSSIYGAPNYPSLIEGVIKFNDEFTAVEDQYVGKISYDSTDNFIGNPMVPGTNMKTGLSLALYEDTPYLFMGTRYSGMGGYGSFPYHTNALGFIGKKALNGKSWLTNLSEVDGLTVSDFSTLPMFGGDSSIVLTGSGDNWTVTISFDDGSSSAETMASANVNTYLANYGIAWDGSTQGQVNFSSAYSSNVYEFTTPAEFNLTTIAPNNTGDQVGHDFVAMGVSENGLILAGDYYVTDNPGTIPSTYTKKGLLVGTYIEKVVAGSKTNTRGISNATITTTAAGEVELIN